MKSNKKKKNKKKIKKKILFLVFGLSLLFILFVIFGICYYFYSPVNNENKNIDVVIPSGSSYYDIASILKEKDLIRNEKFFVLYLKVKGIDNIYAASYRFNYNMNVSKIVDVLLLGGANTNQISITFKEGLNMRQVASLIDKNTDNSYKDVMNKLKDKKYLDSLINKYWFITKDVKNSKIYYSLEGYLYPDTYYISGKDATVEEIFEVMLDRMDEVLSKYKTEIEKSSYSVHELLTISSVTQSEGFTKDDFKKIASVFYNRLNSNMPFGSCVTSYYGVKKDMTDELYQSDIDAVNAYNTRGDGAVLIPVGPVSLPGEDAIVAVIKPIKTDYYYFVSDKNNKLYFTKSYTEHVNMQEKLQNEGLWLEW